MILWIRKINTNILQSSLLIKQLCLMATILLLMISASALGAKDHLILDSCDYANNEDAKKSWKGTYPVKIKIGDDAQKSGALILPCRFFKPKGICYWDKTFTQKIDLSNYKYISFDLYYSGKPIGYRAVYLGFADTKNPPKIIGWYSYMLRFPLKKGWNRFLLKKKSFGREGRKHKDGWTKIAKMRFSFWGTGKGSQEILIDNISASNVPVASNFDLVKVNGELYNSSKLTILPRPQQMKQNDSVFQITSASTSAYISNDEASQRVLSLGTEEFKNNYNITLNKNLISSTSENILILGDINKAKLKLVSLKNKEIKPDGYYLEVCKEYVLLLAKQEKGLYYGFQTLLQLIRQNGQNISISGVQITDYPGLKMRGIYLHRVGDIDKAKKALKMLSAMKFNTVFIDLSSQMKYKQFTFPYSGKKAFSREQMRELAEFAKKYYLDICPYYQFFMHVNWIAAEPKYRYLLENPKNCSWMSSWCPSNPETYRFAFSILDDAIEAFSPKYIHIGHDEIEFSELGRCALCKKSSKETLIANSINKIAEHLKSRKVETIVWADFMMNMFAGRGKFRVDAKKLNALLTPELIMNGWYYGHNREKLRNQINILKNTQKPFIFSPFSDVPGIKLTSEEMQKNDGLGAIMTLWHKWGSFRNFPDAFYSDTLGLIGISANYFWNPSADMIDFDQYDWNFRVRHFLQRDWNIPMPNEKNIYKSINITPYINCKSTDKNQLTKIFGTDSIIWPHTIKLGNKSIELNNGFIILKGHPKDKIYPSRITIPVQQKFKNIIFIQCLNRPFFRKYWEQLATGAKKPQVGAYKISYKDGSIKIIKLKFRFNIETWNSRLGIYDGKLIWQGKSKKGYLMRLWAMSWKNPFPNKEVAKIEFITSSISNMNPMLFGIVIGN